MPSAQTQFRKKAPRSRASAPNFVPSFECQCGEIHRCQNGQLPVGWSVSSGTVFCPACTLAGIPARVLPRRDGRSDRVRLRGEVIELLREGQRIMPPGAAARVDWVQRVNALLTNVSASAA